MIQLYPNPGKSCFAFTHLEKNKEIHCDCGYFGIAINNVAEYTALFHSLLCCKRKGLFDMKVHGDSMLVPSQVSKKVKNVINFK